MRNWIVGLACVVSVALSTSELHTQEYRFRVFLVQRPLNQLLTGSSSDIDQCRDAQNVAPVDKDNCGKHIVELPDNPDLQYRSDADANCDIVIRVFDATGNAKSLNDAGVSRVQITVGDHPAVSPLLIGTYRYARIRLRDEIFRVALNDATHGTPIVIMIQGVNGSPLATTMVKWNNKWAGYGQPLFGSRDIGIWLPIGILATNFAKTNDGIEFSALPIGAALGTRLQTSPNFYLGVSGIGMYSIVHAEKDQTSDSTSNSDKVSLSSVAAGGLVDIGGMLYLTVTRHFDLTGDLHARTMYGIGAGPELLRLIGAGLPRH